MSQERIARLILLYCMDSLSDPEKKELEDWRNQSAKNQETFDQLTDFKVVGDYMEIESRIEKAIAKQIQPRSITLLFFMRKYALPAAAILFLFVGIYLWGIKESPKLPLTAVSPTKQPINDVSPGTFKAKLKLGDGREIILDSANKGLLAKQDLSEIYNSGNLIEYSSDKSANGPISYNTLETNTGETFPVKLSDGTKVWLNSRSSIRFPVAFRGSERRVEITGEVYFEVQKSNTPFKVVVNKESNSFEVNVLGTHFNVNAYTDEVDSKTTLLEGRVAVKMLKTNEVNFIRPGQQVSVNEKGNLQVLNDINTDAIVAWKEQTFYFESSDLKSVMRQLSRWYGISVSYDGNIADRRFSGLVSRSRNLSEVLKMLASNNIHFTIDGKNLIVKP